MAFDCRVRSVFVRAHERLMSAPRSVVLAAAFVASVLVVVACAYGVLSSRHAVTVADSAAGGEGRVVVSWGRTVGDLLADGGVPVGECDQVTPSVDTSLAGVDEVSVVRCRSALVHDGAGGVVAVGAVRPDTLGVLRDVADARGMNVASRASRDSDDDSGLSGATAGLTRSGSGDSGAGAVIVSAPSQEGVPVNSGSTPVPVHVVADGKTVNGVAEDGASARDVAASAGVTASPLDEVTVGLDADGGVVVRVVRVWRGEETVSTADKAVEEKRDTDSLLVGEWTLTPGADGAHDVTMFSVKRDGERVHSVVLGENTVAARPAVREVGTKPVSPEVLVAAGVDPASPVSEETDSAGVVTARYRAPLYSLTSREDVDRLLGKTSSTGDATDAQGASAGGVSHASSAPTFNPSGSKADWMRAAGISDSDFGYVDYIISHESGWNYHAVNRSSGAYGLPQSLPAGKLASAGADWRDNPVTQLRWANNYAVGRYGSWEAAYYFWTVNHWW